MSDISDGEVIEVSAVEIDADDSFTDTRNDMKVTVDDIDNAVVILVKTLSAVFPHVVSANEETNMGGSGEVILDGHHSGSDGLTSFAKHDNQLSLLCVQNV